ncbi:HDOD domain-containing protein [Aquisalimonas lutea]|uniref:HDOD domain-containing protein n=1 Tax=Aquisalimonas lutea TaxID=1327750 RepID=UPI0025B62208|nr:HDOD domain-containing protein [Aquisalimonas lutea]MDN3519654.1 HDOD domain-containing protein [Aquisalimonas lutea]
MSVSVFTADLNALREDITEGRVALPGVPRILAHVREELARPEPEPRRLADCIRQDPGVSAYVIKMANSVAVRGDVDTGTVSGALQRLGLDLTGVLVTNYSLMQMVHRIRGPYRSSVLELYRHSREVAVHCHALARSCARLNSERALLAGLLHDIGKLVTLHFASGKPELREDWRRLEQLLDEGHPDVGAALLRVWRFPEAVVAAVEAHENWIRETDDGEVDLADVVIAAQLDLRRDSDHPMAELAACRVPSLERLGLPPDVAFGDWPPFARWHERSRQLLAV